MPVALGTVAIEGAPAAVPKFTGSTPMTGTRQGLARWIEATVASIVELLETIAGVIGVCVCVSLAPDMKAVTGRIGLPPSIHGASGA